MLASRGGRGSGAISGPAHRPPAPPPQEGEPGLTPGRYRFGSSPRPSLIQVGCPHRMASHKAWGECMPDPMERGGTVGITFVGALELSLSHGRFSPPSETGTPCLPSGSPEHRLLSGAGLRGFGSARPYRDAVFLPAPHRDARFRRARLFAEHDPRGENCKTGGGSAPPPAISEDPDFYSERLDFIFSRSP